MDPESAKRLASGFWKRDYDQCTQTETWTCDKRKLNDKIAKAMLDPEFARCWANQSGVSILDKAYGKGTADAFRHSSGNDRVAMRFYKEQMEDHPYIGIDPAKGKDMAIGYTTWANTNATTTNTFTTASATRDQFMHDEMRMRQQQQMQGMQQLGNINPNQHHKPNVKVVANAPLKSLVRNLPFVCGTGDLLGTLQREFDHWAGNHMEMIT